MNKIKRIPVVEQAEESIRQLIESGEFESGMKLPTEMDLCEKLGVGRGTVREAYRLLQAKGLVEIRPGKGAFVAQENESDLTAVDWLVQNENELLDALEIRIALEPVATRFMTQRCGASEREALKEIHKQLLAAIQGKKRDLIGNLDEQFHSLIVEKSGNALLTEINTQICASMKSFRSKTFQLDQNVMNVVEPHTKILNAIIAGEALTAEREMRLHLEKAKQDLILNIQTH